MDFIQKLFEKKNKNILSIYFTAGFPHLNDTQKILHSLQNHGADLIEVGMPYSDPLADGPVIQNSSMKALKNGMTIKKLFEQLIEIKDEIKIPLILMGYLNPVLQYGLNRFCEHAKNAGISGIILPDLPVPAYENEYQKAFTENGLDFIFLITPETSEERIRKIDSLSNGFIYAVSSSSITGKNADLKAQENYFKRINSLKLKNKILIGFGIRNHQSFAQACEHAAGAIIGTAYINAIEQAENIDEATKIFLNSILKG
ncbi:MAG TPA: tryptophan synthase subunit alpha [Hanamia sp.]|nr:tryptophan synthase subunit alpha [Hanamia sp.]